MLDVRPIPKALANALLAGILFRLCIAPAMALGAIQGLILPVLAPWLTGLAWHRLAAMPLAVVAFVVVLEFGTDLPTGPATSDPALLPSFNVVAPPGIAR